MFTSVLFVLAYVFVSHFVIFAPYLFTANTTLYQRFIFLAASLLFTSLLRFSPNSHIAHAIVPNVMSMIGTVLFLLSRPKDYNLQLCLYLSTAHYLLSRFLFPDHYFPSTHFLCDLLSLAFLFYEMFLYTHLSLLSTNLSVVYVCLYQAFVQPFFPTSVYICIVLLRLASSIYLYPRSLRNIPALSLLHARFVSRIANFVWSVSTFVYERTHRPDPDPLPWYLDPCYSPFVDWDFDPNTSYYSDQYCLYLRIRPGPSYHRHFLRSHHMYGPIYSYYGNEQTTHIYFHHLALPAQLGSPVDVSAYPPGTVFARIGETRSYRLAHHSEAVPYYHYLSLTRHGYNPLLAVRLFNDRDEFHSPVFREDDFVHSDSEDEYIRESSHSSAPSSSSTSEDDFSDPALSSAVA